MRLPRCRALQQAAGQDAGIGEIGGEIAPPHAPRLLQGAIQPLRSAALPGVRRTAHVAGQHVDAAANAHDEGHPKFVSLPGAGCCGAIHQHLDQQAAARTDMRRNIDAWWPQIQAGVEAILVAASGCGTQLKDYGVLLREDEAYAAKAARVSALARDVSEVLAPLAMALLPRLAPAVQTRVVFHPPCSLQHGQRLRGVVEAMLAGLGAQLRRRRCAPVLRLGRDVLGAAAADLRGTARAQAGGAAAPAPDVILYGQHRLHHTAGRGS